MSAPTLSRTGPDRAPDRAAPRRGSDALRAPLAGAVAALAAIGLSELVAGFLGGPSLLAAIGEFVIDHQPPGAKDLVVGVFGTNDKLALEGLIVVVATIVGTGLGLVAVHRSFAIAAGAFGAFAVAGFFAALGSPEAAPTSAMIVAVVAAISGVQVLSFLLGAAGAGRTVTGGPKAIAAPDWSRRGFLLQAAGVAVASSVAGLVGRRLLEGEVGGGGPTS